MEKQGLSAIVLRRTTSLAWVTNGAPTWINTAATECPVTAVITGDAQYLITDNIEGPRLIEELKLPEQGWEVLTHPWHASATGPEELCPSGAGVVVGTDVALDIPGVTTRNVAAALAYERSLLTTIEQQRAKDLARDCADAMVETAERVQPGQTEYEIAAHLWERSQARGIQAIVALIATDERIFRFRHPLPTAKRLDRYAMLVTCGRRDGLVTSMTRLIHFGPVPDEVLQRHHAVVSVDAKMIADSQPGRTTGDVFRTAQAAYADAGYPDGWHGHHQGGVIGYEPREFLGLPGGEEVLHAGMTCTWNPSLPGAKSEDTFLIGPEGPQILTTTPSWPMLEPVAGAPARPGILVP